MTDIRRIKTASLYEHKYSYSRAVQAGDWILVSNTAGRNYDTREIAPDAAGQTEQVFRNVEAALARLGASLKDVVRIRLFVPDPRDVETVLAIVGERFRGIDPANTTTCTPLAQPELKVEMEVTAYRPQAGAR